MDWLKGLADSAIALDSAPIIYFIERHPTYAPFVTPFFEALDGGEFRAVTSTLTLTEVLVHPLRSGNSALAERYFQILTTSRNLAVLPVSDATASEAARLRAELRLRTPDAIQMANRAHWRREYVPDERQRAWLDTRHEDHYPRPLAGDQLIGPRVPNRISCAGL